MAGGERGTSRSAGPDGSPMAAAAVSTTAVAAKTVTTEAVAPESMAKPVPTKPAMKSVSPAMTPAAEPESAKSIVSAGTISAGSHGQTGKDGKQCPARSLRNGQAERPASASARGHLTVLSNTST